MAMSKLKEGEMHWAEGEKAAKKNVWTLKFQADNDIAAMEFNQAASCFQAGGDYPRAVAAYEKAAYFREKEGDAFGAGRAYEASATISKNYLQSMDEYVASLRKAGKAYLVAGKPDSSARVLQLVASTMEEMGEVDEAAAAYEECVKLFESNDKTAFVSDVFRKYIDLLVKAGRESEVLQQLDRQMKAQLKAKQVGSFPGTVLCKVVVHLRNGDADAANRDLDNASALEPGFLGSRECSAAMSAIEAFKSCDQKAFQQVMQSGTFVYLPIEFAKISRTLMIPPQVMTAAKQRPKQRSRDGSDEDERPSRRTELSSPSGNGGMPNDFVDEDGELDLA